MVSSHIGSCPCSGNGIVVMCSLGYICILCADRAQGYHWSRVRIIRSGEHWGYRYIVATIDGHYWILSGDNRQHRLRDVMHGDGLHADGLVAGYIRCRPSACDGIVVMRDIGCIGILSTYFSQADRCGRITVVRCSNRGCSGHRSIRVDRDVGWYAHQHRIGHIMHRDHLNTGQA